MFSGRTWTLLTPLQLRKLAYKVINSTTKLLPAWKACLKEHQVPESLIPRDCSTRWDSTYDMCDYAEKHKKPLKAYLADDAHTFELDAFGLSGQEWRCVRQLRNPLKQATLFFSRGDTPNLASVIPAMDRLDRELATFCTDDKLEPSIRAAANIAKSTLNRYYVRSGH
ncbi:hypothetical protein EV121DRAFT_208359 [Schizophyllum commune]